jgi:uncharacterized protein
MMQDNLVARLHARLPDLLGIYIFGSRADGTSGPESDLDIAVLNDGPLDPVALWDIAADLAEIAGCAVDLVDLRSASTVLQYQVLTKGRRLWTRDARTGIYEAFILSEKTALDTLRSSLLDDIAKDGRVHG